MGILRMQLFIISIVVSATMAQQGISENGEQGETYVSSAYDSYYPAQAQGYMQEEPAFKPLQNRNGVEEYNGFYRVLKNMIFALGVLSIINLLLSTAAPGKRNLRADEEVVDEVVTDEAVPEGRMLNCASNILNAIETLEDKYYSEH